MLFHISPINANQFIKSITSTESKAINLAGTPDVIHQTIHLYWFLTQKCRLRSFINFKFPLKPLKICLGVMVKDSISMSTFQISTYHIYSPSNSQNLSRIGISPPFSPKCSAEIPRRSALQDFRESWLRFPDQHVRVCPDVARLMCSRFLSLQLSRSIPLNPLLPLPHSSNSPLETRFSPQAWYLLIKHRERTVLDSGVTSDASSSVTARTKCNFNADKSAWQNDRYLTKSFFTDTSNNSSERSEIDYHVSKQLLHHPTNHNGSPLKSTDSHEHFFIGMSYTTYFQSLYCFPVGNQTQTYTSVRNTEHEPSTTHQPGRKHSAIKPLNFAH